MIQWYIGIIGVYFAVVAIYYLSRTIPSFTGELQKSLKVVLIGGISGLIPPATVIVYGLLGTNLNAIFWQASIALYIILAIYLAHSMRRLERFLDLLKKSDS